MGHGRQEGRFPLGLLLDFADVQVPRISEPYGRRELPQDRDIILAESGLRRGGQPEPPVAAGRHFHDRFTLAGSLPGLAGDEAVEGAFDDRWKRRAQVVGAHGHAPVRVQPERRVLEPLGCEVIHRGFFHGLIEDIDLASAEGEVQAAEAFRQEPQDPLEVSGFIHRLHFGAQPGHGGVHRQPPVLRFLLLQLLPSRVGESEDFSETLDQHQVVVINEFL